jgi:hypothetical protein
MASRDETRSARLERVGQVEVPAPDQAEEIADTQLREGPTDRLGGSRSALPLDECEHARRAS